MPADYPYLSTDTIVPLRAGGTLTWKCAKTTIMRLRHLLSPLLALPVADRLRGDGAT